MLIVPDIKNSLAMMDERALETNAFNPFDSHTRLQAMMEKAKRTETLVWCVEALSFQCLEGTLTSPNECDIKGTTATSNRGLFDLYLFKKQLKGLLFHKANQLFDGAGRDWIEQVAAKHTESFLTWRDQVENKDLSWRTCRKQSEIAWLNLVVQAVFRGEYDTVLKAAQENGETAE